MGVVVRRCINFHILLIPLPLVSVRFCNSIPTFCSFLKCFFRSLLRAELPFWSVQWHEFSLSIIYMYINI